MNYIYTLKDFRCDKHCPYCITKILNKTMDEDVKDFPDILNKVEGLYDYFILSGNGEPSLYKEKDLGVIVESVNKTNQFKAKRIQTSGVLFRQKKKLALFEGWWKEITVVSCDFEKDMAFFNYKKHYLQETLGRSDVRCNYTLLLEKFNSKEYLEDIKVLVERYPYVALKLLDTNDKWVVDNAVPYAFKDYLLAELEQVLGLPSYNEVGCRYEWNINGCFVSMSYGKVKGHDNIQIENIGGRK